MKICATLSFNYMILIIIGNHHTNIIINIALSLLSLCASILSTKWLSKSFNNVDLHIRRKVDKRSVWQGQCYRHKRLESLVNIMLLYLSGKLYYNYIQGTRKILAKALAWIRNMRFLFFFVNFLFPFAFNNLRYF